jgi:hypothetical protein
LRAGIGQEHLDNAAALFFRDAGQHEVPVQHDGQQQQDAHDRGGCLVVRAAPGNQPKLFVLDGHRGHDRLQLARIDPGGRGALLDGNQLDRPGDDGTQRLVWFAQPRQRVSVIDEYGNVSVA